MDLTRQLLQQLYDEKLSQDFDRIIIVLGDEGAGKSTLMLQLAWFHRGIVPELDDPTVQNVTGDIAWDINEYKQKLADGSKYRPVIVHDATRVMSKKKAMHTEQVELEEDLFDARYGRKLHLLGYQEWSAVPTVLQERRAENTFHVTSRGKFKVYGRKHMDQKVKNGKWPKTNFVDSFDKLDGTRLWDSFREKDEAKKQERIEPESEEEQMTPHEVADDIMESSMEDYVSVHGGNGTRYVDRDLIMADYGLSRNQAAMAKKLVEREKAEMLT